MATGKVDDFTARMFDAINGMMLDVLATIVREDYEDSRRRQMQGQAKAKAAGKYVGHPENKRQYAHRLDRTTQFERRLVAAAPRSRRSTSERAPPEAL